MIFPEVKIYQPDVFEDFRGELYTLFKQEEHELVFNHDKVSISKKHVLRGLHGDSKSWKLVTCLAGEIYFVVVDNRPKYYQRNSIFFTPLSFFYISFFASSNSYLDAKNLPV